MFLLDEIVFGLVVFVVVFLFRVSLIFLIVASSVLRDHCLLHPVDTNK